MDNATNHLSFHAKVISNVSIADGVYLISFVRTFDFIAGQVIAAGIDNNAEVRLYSIASGIYDDEIQLLYSVKPGGYLTPKLENLRPGDTIYHSSPTGTFIGDPNPAVCIATGTGIAPFISMFQSGWMKGKELIHGNSNASGLYFRKELESSEVKYIPCCSREKADGTFPGRVTDYIKTRETDNGMRYYLCGRAEMVVEARDILISKGVRLNQIMSEIYF